MAGTLTIGSSTITGQSGSNGVSSTKVIGPLTIQASNPIIQVQDVSFSSASFQNFTPPFGATAVVIVPPSNNLIGLTLKGVTGDTGIPLSTNFPTVISLAVPAGQSAAFGLTSAGAIVGVIELNYF